MSGSEFARPVRIDTLGEAPRTIEIAAKPEERAALATRFGLESLAALAATATVRRDGMTVIAEGRLRAEVVQSCVATGDPVPATLDEPFALRFVPAGSPGGDEIELSETDLDTIDYDGAAIDLGEAVAETLSLALDPFPRCADADDRLRAAGVLQEDEVETGPFAALKGLRDKLG